MIKNLPRIWLSTCGRTWGQRTKKSIDWNQRREREIGRTSQKRKLPWKQREHLHAYTCGHQQQYITLIYTNIINSLEFRAETFFFFSFYFSFSQLLLLLFISFPIDNFGIQSYQNSLWPTNKQNHLHCREGERDLLFWQYCDCFIPC